MLRTRLVASILPLLAIALAGCTGQQASVTDTTASTVMEAIRIRPELSEFARMLDASGVSARLEGVSPYTVLAPTNAALASLPGTLTAETLLGPGNDAMLLGFVEQHLIAAIVDDTMLESTDYVSFNGIRIASERDGGRLIINGSAVRTGPTTAGNGVLYTVDGAILKKKE